MAKQLSDMILPSDPQMLDTVDAMTRYHEAQASGHAKAEIERL